LLLTLGIGANTPLVSSISTTLSRSIGIIHYLFFSWHEFLKQQYVYGPLEAGLEQMARQQGLVIPTHYLDMGLLNPRPNVPTNYHTYTRPAADPSPLHQSPTITQRHDTITFLNMCMEGLYMDECFRIAIIPGNLNLSNPNSADLILRFLGEIKALVQYLPGAIKIIVTITVGRHRFRECIQTLSTKQARRGTVRGACVIGTWFDWGNTYH
jgi:hypothetical protein